MTENKHTELLYNYLSICPKEYNHILKRFAVDRNINNSDQLKPFDKFKDSSFNGLVFKNNRVLVYNILIFNKDLNYRSDYLDITTAFNHLLDYYNIIHLCIIIPLILFKYYRENIIAEKIILYIKHQNDERFKPKFRHEITKHRGREGLFITDNRNANTSKWNQILFSAINQIGFGLSNEQEKEGLDICSSVFAQAHELLNSSNKYGCSNGL